MEEDYQKALEVIFSHENKCFDFKHNICGDHPEVPDGMPDSSFSFPYEFFSNPRCPWSQRPLRIRWLRRI